MKFSPFTKSCWNRGSAVLGMVTALTLCSCGEKEEAPAAPAVEETSAATEQKVEEEPAVETPELSRFDATRDALFDHVVFQLTQKVSNPELYPEVNAEVRDALALLNDYYAALEQEPEMAEERVRTALLIAGMTCDLGAYAKASAAYENALKQLELLPEDVRGGRDAKRSLSTIESGLGACLLYQGKSADALAHFQKSLDTDLAVFKELRPDESKPLEENNVDPELALAASAVMDSYRCLGDCQNVMGDTEDARETYKKGLEMVPALRVVTPKMAISYIKLLIASADLENSLGNMKGAYVSWFQAGDLSKKIALGNHPIGVRAEAKRLNESLIRPLLQVEAKLKEEQRKAAEAEAAAKPADAPVTEAPLQPVPEAAPEVAPAPVVAPEAEAPKPAPKKPRNNRRRNKRNR